MNAQPHSPERFLEPTILFTWRELRAQAAPDASQTFIAQQPQLLPRFAAYHSYLQQLPRRVRRSLQRQLRRVRPRIGVRGERADDSSVRGKRPTRIQSLAGVALLLALGQAPAFAATINVGGGCKLVDAITAANTNNAIGRCRAGRGPDTIVLPANSTQTLTAVNNGYVGPSGLPVVTSTITIAGNGSTVARSSAAGTPEFRILVVGAGGNLTLRQATISGGVLPGDSRGGGVYRRSGSLILDRCTISGNTAYLGGGVANAAAGTLTVTNSFILNNRATGNQGAGGVFNNGHVVNTVDGKLIMTNSSISGNTAKFGGGLRNDGVAAITNSNISGNTADASAGGVANLQSLTLTNSAILGNIARDDGGGVWSSQGAANSQATITLTNTTVSNNSVSNRGGGLYNSLDRITLTNSTVTGNGCDAGCKGGGVFSGGRVDNLRSDVILKNTLISGNKAGVAYEIYQVAGGVVSANNFNLFGHSGLDNALAFTGFTPGPSDLTATSDGIRPTALASILNPGFANNGGSTANHALVAGSPAIDAIATGCPPPAKDQRGQSRPQDGNKDGIALCDIGAFELE